MRKKWSPFIQLSNWIKQRWKNNDQWVKGCRRTGYTQTTHREHINYKRKSIPKRTFTKERSSRWSDLTHH